jgi:hypothetical protein
VCSSDNFLNKVSVEELQETDKAKIKRVKRDVLIGIT